jgi:probable O-glycosylation ligase (exosortase A-associated)
MVSFRDIALTVFILGMLPFVLARPHVGILLWTWIGLMNPHKMTWGFAFHFPFAQIVGLVTILAIVLSKEPKRLPLKAPVVALSAFIGWMIVTTVLFSLYPDEAYTKLWAVLKIQFFIFLTLMVMQTRDRIQALVLVATLSIAFFGIKGGIYTIARGGGGQVLGPDGGFIAGNTEIALALAVTLPLMRWLQLQTDRVWLRRAATVSMILISISILGSQSRGGFLALAAMALFLLFKSRQKVVVAFVVAIVGAGLLMFMPTAWHERMGTIENYQQDTSAMGRIGAWTFATNLALARPIGGGGFETFQRDLYERYGPPGASILDSHSIWFQVLAEHGFVGLGLFLLVWLTAWRTGSRIIRLSRDRADLTWARDLAAMTQTALIAYFVGGSFLGLAYWDYPYILVVMLVATRVAVERHLKDIEVEQVRASASGPRLQAQDS